MSTKKDIPDLPAISPDNLDEGSVRKLLKDIFPQPTDPLTEGLQKGEDYKQARLFFRNDDGSEESVTGYHALSDAARRKFMSNFFVEIEVADQAKTRKRFFVSEYDAERAKKFGAKLV